jgi:tetratricopeptide (TPR) repeat protein
LACYDVLEKPGWPAEARVRYLPAAEQEALREDVGELLLLLARATAQEAVDRPPGAERDEQLRRSLELNERAETCYAADQVPPTLWQQRADVCRRLGQHDDADRFADRGHAAPQSARDLYLLAADYASEGRYRLALPLLRKATRQDPKNFWASFIQGICHDRLGQEAEAIACYSSCISLWPEYPWSYFNRGSVLLRRDAEQARADLDQAVRLDPEQAEPYVNRALAFNALGKHAEAVADLTRALELGAGETRLYFLRARIRDKAGDREGAKRDRAEGFKRQPTDERSWIARGVARLEKEPQAALADFREALRVNPRSFGALQNIANVLGDEPGRLQEAVDALTKALEYAPDFVPARSGRGVLLARQGKRAEALADAEEALLRDPSPRIVYQVAGIYAQTSKQQPDDRLRALSLLAAALRQGFGYDDIDSDPDLEPIRNLPEFRRLTAAAQALRK